MHDLKLGSQQAVSELANSRAINLTNNAPSTLFCQGKSVMPCSAGSVFIMYSKDRKPGISIVNQAIRPGIFKILFTDVLPIPYHGKRY